MFVNDFIKDETLFCTANNDNLKGVSFNLTWICQDIEFQFEMAFFGGNWFSYYYGNCTKKKIQWTDSPISSIINEGIRAILNLFIFFYKKISHAQKAQKAQNFPPLRCFLWA